MEPWKALLVAFGGNVTLLFLLGYFGRSLVSQVLAKDIEKFKADLQLAAVEHQVRFSKLHERRPRFSPSYTNFWSRQYGRHRLSRLSFGGRAILRRMTHT